MVNANRVKSKIPSLLVEGKTTKKANKSRVMRDRYRLIQFQKRNPQRFNKLFGDLLNLLNEIDSEMKKEVNK